MTESANSLALLADVGGTNTRVALARDGRVDPSSVAKFRNAEHDDLASVLNAYLSNGTTCPTAAAVAVAGPVRDGRGELTNISWAFDETSLGDACNIASVHILNDLQAQGYALGRLQPGSTRQVLPGTGQSDTGQTKIVVGVGTGFNTAPVFERGPERLVAPSESGHQTLPQDNGRQRALAEWLEKELGFASLEDALSGRGIENLYRFCANGAQARSSTEIMAAAAAGGEADADRTVELFVQILGAAMGNLALTILPYGGLYLIGGMARAVAPYFDRFGFAEAFQGKGRFHDLMEEFPVYLVEDDFAALSGCAAFIGTVTKSRVT